jgi:co-chaperonin GroES (HSP10)
MIKPCSYHVLVRPDSIQERQGMIYLPQSTREREQYAQVFGTIVDIGPTAWKGFDDGKPWAKIGDRVSYAKYGGVVLEDPETKEHFRLLLDKDIVAIISGEYQMKQEA